MKFNFNFNPDLRMIIAAAVILLLLGIGLCIRNAVKMSGTIEEMFLPEQVIERKLQKDFPGAQAKELRSRTELALSSIFQAITSQELSLLKDCGPQVEQQVTKRLEENLSQGRREYFEKVSCEPAHLIEYKSEDEKTPVQISLKVYVKMLHYIKEGEQIVFGSTEKPEQAEYILTLLAERGSDSRDWRFCEYRLDYLRKINVKTGSD